MRNKRLIQAIAAVFIICASVIFGLKVGPKAYSFGEIFAALFDSNAPDRLVIFDLRLPRILLALFSGAILTLGGFYMQSLIKNPLADPYIMGLSTGAGFGVNLLILGIVPIAGLTIITYPLFAFFGGLLSLALVILLGYNTLREDSPRLLIAGIAVSSLFTALTGLLIYKFSEFDQVRQVLFWSFGSLNTANWTAVGTTGVLLLAGWLFGMVVGNRLDVLILGDQQARTLGMHVQRLKLAVLLVTALVVGGGIAFTGPIGFVGMMIPHFSRGLNGIQHRANLVFGTIFGGVYLLWCDLASQLIHPPAGLPIGIVTAILGVPFFLYLLFVSGYRIS